VFAVFHAVRYPPGQAGEFAARGGEPKRARTPCGRFARSGTSAVSVFAYFPLAVGVVVGGSVIAAITSSDMFVLGYVIYGGAKLARAAPQGGSPASLTLRDGHRFQTGGRQRGHSPGTEKMTDQ
jgi:hypothetical protein